MTVFSATVYEDMNMLLAFSLRQQTNQAEPSFQTSRGWTQVEPKYRVRARFTY